MDRDWDEYIMEVAVCFSYMICHVYIVIKGKSNAPSRLVGHRHWGVGWEEEGNQMRIVFFLMYSKVGHNGGHQ